MILALSFTLLISLWPSNSVALECRTFDIYKGIQVKEPRHHLIDFAVNELKEKISSLPGHSNFSKLYPGENKEVLNCLWRYLSSDADGDGLYDWKAITQNRLQNLLLPADRDWDNDGLENIFDAEPFSSSFVKQQILPPHLWLHPNSKDDHNQIQSKIFQNCGVVALNHTAKHSVRTLNALSGLCATTLKRFKSTPYTFVLYAFAGHGHTKKSIASFHPTENFMSIAGEDRLATISEQQILNYLSHEVGHFLIFNSMSPSELVEVGRKHGGWIVASSNIESFYHPELLQAPEKNRGYLPSAYSGKNLHEWLSEVFSIHLSSRLRNESSPSKSELPKDLQKWVRSKLDDRLAVHKSPSNSL